MSPQPEPLYPNKPRERPKFNRIKLKKPSQQGPLKSPIVAGVNGTPTKASVNAGDQTSPSATRGSADDETLSFFHRSKETFVISRSRKSNGGSSQTKRSIEKYDSASDGDGSDGDKGESLRERRRYQGTLMKERYQKLGANHARRQHSDDFGDDDDDDGLSSTENSSRSKARRTIREASITPPPQLYPNDTDDHRRRKQPLQSLQQPPLPSSRPPRTPKPSSTITIDLDSDDDEQSVGLSANITKRRRIASSNRANSNDYEAPSADNTPAPSTRGKSRAEPGTRTQEQLTLEPIVPIFISSPIEGTKPFIFKRRLDQTLREVRSTWCRNQNLPPSKHNEIFLVWKMRTKVFDFVTCKGLGITVDSNGEISPKDGTLGENIYFEAMTEELLVKRLKGELEDDQAEEEEGEPVAPIRLTLKAKDMQEYRIKVKPTTTIQRLMDAYKAARDIDSGKRIRLDFEGDTLSPEETIADTDLEDMCLVDVYII